MDGSFILSIAIAVMLLSTWALFLQTTRSPRIVLLDLISEQSSLKILKQGSRKIVSLVNHKLIWVFIFLLVIICGVRDFLDYKKVAIIFIIAGSLLIFLRSYLISQRKEKINLSFQYALPLMMERLMMTIESGQDVISGLKLIVTQDSDIGSSKNSLLKMFAKVLDCTEQGLTFTQSLREVSAECPVAAVRHSLIHLALAYEQGGELIVPLRELSDATQLQYQELVEERIAKLPVKATIPLLLLFAGLIILFVTPPVLEVITLTNGGRI